MLAARRALCAIAAAAALLVAGGCATITRGITQDIQIATDPAGASCQLRDQAGTLIDAIDLTPGYVRVRKGLQTYAIDCVLAGYLDARTKLEPGVETGAVGSATMGAFSGITGTTGSTLTSAALSSVMPAATAATYATWLGIAGAVALGIDLATGAVFEFTPSVALTLVPSSFTSDGARDLFFQREEQRLQELHAIRRKLLVEECRVACLGAIKSMDDALARDVAELERLRAGAQVAGARGP